MGDILGAHVEYKFLWTELVFGLLDAIGDFWNPHVQTHASDTILNFNEEWYRDWPIKSYMFLQADENIINSINPIQRVHFNVKEPLVNVKVADILVLYQSTSKNCFQQTRKNFQKLKEVLHHNMMIYNNLSHCLHRWYRLGESKSSSEGKCSDFKKTVLVTKFKESFQKNGVEF